MRTRPDAHHETLTRRLALLRAGSPDEGWPGDGPAAATPHPAQDEDGRAWWSSHTGVPDELDETWPAAEPSTLTGAAPPAPPPAPLPALPPVLLPVPGRHAARRRLGLVLRLPEVLQGRARIGPAQLSVVALVVAAALALTCWWLVRGRATTLAPPTPASPSAAASPLVALASPAAQQPVSGTSPAAVAASSGSMVTVDVEGKVRHPGIVILPAGSRVTDALEAAGGVPRRRSLGGLNLAAVLVDGQQITVGAKTSAAGTGGTAGVAAPGSAGSSDGGAGDGSPVDLNTATADQLDTLPGVGPVTAQAILDWRQQNGGFTSVQELLEVDGIGPATLEKIAPHATV